MVGEALFEARVATMGKTPVGTKMHKSVQSQARNYGRPSPCCWRAIDARLLVAVPSGPTASDSRLIRRVLWKNPRIQRWRKKPNEEDDDEEVVVQQPPTVHKCNVTRRHPASKHEKFVDSVLENVCRRR